MLAISPAAPADAAVPKKVSPTSVRRASGTAARTQVFNLDDKGKVSSAGSGGVKTDSNSKSPPNDSSGDLGAGTTDGGLAPTIDGSPHPNTAAQGVRMTPFDNFSTDILDSSLVAYQAYFKGL